jgi:hypothetical protein
MNFSGKEYVSSPKSDPVNLASSDTLGVAPQNTTLSITYRSNTVENTNAAVGTVTQVVDPILFFENEQLLDRSKVAFIRNNVQVYNEDPINGNISIPNTEELKRRYLGTYGAQGRAVTKADYISMVYSMPGIYGSVKRASVIRDTNDYSPAPSLGLLCHSSPLPLRSLPLGTFKTFHADKAETI